MSAYKCLLSLLGLLIICPAGVLPSMKHEEGEATHCVLQIPNTTLIINITTTHELRININETTNEFMRINFCAPLTYPCAYLSHYAACYHNAYGEQFGVGTFPPELSLHEDNVVFSYLGDQCNSTHKYITRFELICDFFEEHEFYVEADDYSLGDCEFYVILRTPYACARGLQYSCALEHHEEKYSLDRLKNTRNNYVITINRTLSVILNVCHSLVFWNPIANCGSSSAICLIDQSSYTEINYTNLGNIEHQTGITYSDDGVIKIHYQNGGVCGSDKTKRLRSTITFICDVNAKEGDPKYAGGLESCDLHFVWKTAAACSEEVLTKSSLITRGPCQIADPVSGNNYDFSKLHENNIHFPNSENSDLYTFSVCNAVDSVYQCATRSGSCKINKETNLTISGGLANSQLLWSPRMGLYLNYTEGDQCTNDQRRYTVIELTCGKNNAIDAIDNHCSTTIIFETSSACPRVCSSHRHNLFDSLMDSTVGHIIKRDNIEYSFNICVSIDQMEYFNCVHGGAGVCQTTHEDDKSHEEISLGYPEPLPKIKDKNVIALNFVNGSVCDEDKSKNISSKISLICDVNVTKSYPDFHSYEECVYHFVWPSRQSCGIVDCTINNDDCSIENDLDHRWNLTSLLIHQVPSTRRNSSYSIAICEKSNAVDESAVFTKEMSFGKLMKVSTDYTKNVTLKLYFGHGSSCAHGVSHARSVLYLICDETRDSGEPVLLWEEECSVGFEWRTRLVCSPGRKLIDSSTLSWLIAVLITILLTMLIVVIIIFLRRNPVYLDAITNHLITTWNRIVIYPRGLYFVHLKRGGGPPNKDRNFHSR